MGETQYCLTEWIHERDQKAHGIDPNERLKETIQERDKRLTEWIHGRDKRRKEIWTIKESAVA